MIFKPLNNYYYSNHKLQQNEKEKEKERESKRDRKRERCMRRTNPGKLIKLKRVYIIYATGIRLTQRSQNLGIDLCNGGFNLHIAKSQVEHWRAHNYPAEKANYKI